MKKELKTTSGQKHPEVVKYLIIPDTHVPYHDRRAWALMTQAGEVIKPDSIICLGDFGDMYSVSDHNKNPNRTRHLEDEVGEVNNCLDDLDALGATDKVFIAGNHEDRLERYLMTKAPELFNMVQIPDLYNLRKRGWKYIPYKGYYKVAHVYFTHDTGRSGRYTAYQSQQDVGTNTVVGHAHRLAWFVEGTAEGKPHMGTCLGWLGDVNKVDYMHKVRALRDWALGFGIGYLDTKTQIMHIQAIPIVNYQCLVEGKLLRLEK